jgi:hypothetical protein
MAHHDPALVTNPGNYGLNFPPSHVGDWTEIPAAEVIGRLSTYAGHLQAELLSHYVDRSIGDEEYQVLLNRTDSVVLALDNLLDTWTQLHPVTEEAPAA